MSHSDIARHYGIPRRTVTAIINGENWQHVSEPTVHNDPRRKPSPTTKLAPEQVVEIRQLHANGVYGCRQLAKMFGVQKSTILKILSRKIWRNLK
jgi:DNA invertase Pin-like site-specific DNA recombinase